MGQKENNNSLTNHCLSMGVHRYSGYQLFSLETLQALAAQQDSKTLHVRRSLDYCARDHRSGVLSIRPQITDRACFTESHFASEITGREGCFCIRKHFRFSFYILFEIALFQTAHCFEMCFVRPRKHRKVPYANLVQDIHGYFYLGGITDINRFQEQRR